MSERILLSEMLALSGNSWATSLQRMAWPPLSTRFKTVLVILSSPAGPDRDRMISGMSVSVAGSLSKTKPRSARGKISNSELKIRSRTSRRAQGCLRAPG